MSHRMEQTVEFSITGKDKDELLSKTKAKLAELGFEHYDLAMNVSEGRTLMQERTGDLHAKVTAYVHDYFD